MPYYLVTLVISFAVSAAFMPLCILAARKLNIMDFPTSSIKTHTSAVPYLGGAAVFAGFVLSLALIRYLSHFPTGTLYQLRGIVIGSTVIFVMGVVDDIHDLDYKIKFFVQIVAASVLFRYGIGIKIFQVPLLNYVLSVLWILAITNGFNIIDVMDGLTATVLIASGLFFFLVSLPTEQIYVNFSALAVFGAAAGFLLFNFPPAKVFMGDAGSLTTGFIMAAISLGAKYSAVHPVGIFAPMLILAIPLFDLLFVMIHRTRRGLSPFLGSKDHFALRMLKLGFSKKEVLLRVFITSAVLGFSAWLLTIIPMTWAFVLSGFLIIIGFYLASWLSVIDMSD